jgi:hypothetical protein
LEPDVVAFLEQLFESGFAWDEAELAGLSGRLEAFGGSPVAGLADTFTTVEFHLAAGDVPEPRRREVEAVIYPRLWKVLEAVRGGLPEGEQRNRVQVLNRRLAQLLAGEVDPLVLRDAAPPPG